MTPRRRNNYSRGTRSAARLLKPTSIGSSTSSTAIPPCKRADTLSASTHPFEHRGCGQKVARGEARSARPWSVYENRESSEGAKELPMRSVALPVLDVVRRVVQRRRASFARTCLWLPYAAPLALPSRQFNCAVLAVSSAGADPRLTNHVFRISLNPL